MVGGWTPVGKLSSVLHRFACHLHTSQQSTPLQFQIFKIASAWVCHAHHDVFPPAPREIHIFHNLRVPRKGVRHYIMPIRYTVADYTPLSFSRDSFFTTLRWPDLFELGHLCNILWRFKSSSQVHQACLLLTFTIWCMSCVFDLHSTWCWTDCFMTGCLTLPGMHLQLSERSLRAIWM